MVPDHEKIMKYMLRLSIHLLFENIPLCNSLNELLILVLRCLYLVFSAFVFLNSCLFIFRSNFGVEAIWTGH